MRRAIRWGAGLMLSGMYTAAEIGATLREYRELCSRRSVAPGPVACIRRGFLGDAAASQRFLDRFVSQMESSVSYERHAGQEWVRSLRSEKPPWLDDIVFAGEPERVAEGLRAWAEPLGIEHVILKLHWGQDRDFELLPEQLERAGTLCRAVA